MKKFILFLTCFCFLCWGSAQTTITNASFPETGDTLKTAVDLAPTDIEVTPAGGPYDWDYSNLSVGIQGRDYYLDASEGSLFDEVPNATHVVTNEQNDSEGYYIITDQAMEFIGASGNDPAGFGLGAFLRFTPPVVQRRAPMNFQESNSSETNVLLALAWEDLPTLLTDSLNFPITPDSIRIRITANRDDSVDAYGTVTIPGGSYEVLREKRTQISETGVDILLPIFGWSDVTSLLPFEGLGADTTITYDFFSNVAKEVIVTLTVDANDSVISATFKDNDILDSNEEILGEKPLVFLSPNPVGEQANFEFKNFLAGKYQLSLLGLYGNIISHHSLQLFGNQKEQFDFSNLANGSYFYFLQNERGEIAFQGKMIKQ